MITATPMLNTPPATGALFSIQDYRDQIVAAAVAAPVKSPFALPATLRSQLDTPMMQASVPACVSHSAVDHYKLYWYFKTGDWVDFSPRFLDVLAKRFDNQDRATGGTYPRLVFQLLVKYGCATTATLPNDTSLPVLTYRDDAVLTDAVLEDAAKYKAPGYVSVPLDFTTTRQYIDLYGSVSTLLTIGDELWVPSWADKDIDPMRTPDVPVSGHQMTPFGWEDETYNLIRNEWSEAWANKGNNRYNPVVWAPYIHEQWVVAAIPQSVADFIKALPRAQDFHYAWNTNLSQGQYSNDVKFAQVAFMILGYLKAVEPSELGYFGPKTALANYLYQIDHGIAPSPKNIGPLTRKALNAQFSV